jgi:hypothetical protein
MDISSTAFVGTFVVEVPGAFVPTIAIGEWFAYILSTK